MQQDQGTEYRMPFISSARATFGPYSKSRKEVVETFDFTGNIVAWNKPALSSNFVEVHMWGAGGGHGIENAGGCGGYSYGIMNMSNASILYIAVGGGGKSYDNYLGPTLGNCNGCGGGLSGIFTLWNTGDLNSTHAGSVIVAGAGGAGGNTGNAGGCGGGLVGGRETGANPSGNGNPGTQIAAGVYPGTTGGSCTAETCSGDKLRGGVGCGGAQQPGFSGWPNEAWGGTWAAGAGGNGCNAGGGGGGYYGGSGGGSQETNGSSGGGGSSYVGGNALVPVIDGATQITISPGTSTIPPQTSNLFYASGIATGGSATNIDGGNGRVVFVYYV